MPRLLTLASILLFLACHSNPPPQRDPGSLRIEAIDRPATKELFGDNPTFELLLSGMDWSEGPLVLPHGQVICSDVPKNHIRAWPQMEDGPLYLDKSGSAPDDYSGEPGSNGLLIGNDGRLLLAQHGARRVARMLTHDLRNPVNSFETVADNWQGKQFNSPNDLIQAQDGTIFFTDPPWGLPGRLESDAREIDFDGVYRVDTDGTVTALIRDFDKPNGIGLSPDESVLYVGGGPLLYAYPLSANHQVGDPTVLIDATDLQGKESEPGSVDGLVVRSDGLLFATAPGGVWALEPDGTVLAKVRTGMPVSNVELSSRQDWLYLTSDSQLIRVKLNTPTK